MASLDLFRMLSEGLLAEVRSATAQAKSENVAVTRDGLQIERGGRRAGGPGSKSFRSKFLLPGSGSSWSCSRNPRRSSVPLPTAAADPSLPTATNMWPSSSRRSVALREYLQSVIEEQESTNEELKSANEEILSANEELQSTNEELQTAKEEAQSANEELATVNDELRHRNFELARVNDDLVNVLSGVNIPIVMVSRDLRIRRFTPLAEKTSTLIPSDIGRPISDIKPNLEVADVAGLITAVIDSLTPYESRGQRPWRALVLTAHPALRHTGQQDRRRVDRPGRHRHDPPRQLPSP